MMRSDESIRPHIYLILLLLRKQKTPFFINLFLHILPPITHLPHSDLYLSAQIHLYSFNIYCPRLASNHRAPDLTSDVLTSWLNIHLIKHPVNTTWATHLRLFFFLSFPCKRLWNRSNDETPPLTSMVNPPYLDCLLRSG